MCRTSPLVFDLVLNAEEQCYSVESVVWSPSADGLPISRNRRYTLCRRLASFTRKLDFNYDALQQYFFASQVAEAHLFFQASADMLNELNKDLAIKRGLPPMRTTSRGGLFPWHWPALMNLSERQKGLGPHARGSAKSRAYQSRAAGLST